MIQGICAGLFAGLVVLIIGLLVPKKCPKCGTKLPRTRAPKTGGPGVQVGWICPNCGTQLDRRGKLIKEGAGVPMAVAQPDDTPKKTCPKCAEKIQLDARVCIHCGQEFTDADIQAARQQVEDQARAVQQAAQDQASQDKEAYKVKRSRDQSQALVIVGGLLAAAGALFTLLLILVSLFPQPATSAQSGGSGSVAILFACSVPLLAIGAVLLFLGIKRLRRAPGKENSVIPPVS